MPFQLPALRQLEQLSQALSDSGDDLQSILAVLVDDLSAAIPSFTGLLLRVQVEGEPVIISAIAAAPATASILLPLHLFSDLPVPSELILYAAEPGAFVHLAADARAAHRLDGQVQLDHHLPPPDGAAVGVDGGAPWSIINQALGVLIAQGHPPEQARDELDVRARVADVPRLQAALEIIEMATASHRAGRLPHSTAAPQQATASSIDSHPPAKIDGRAP